MSIARDIVKDLLVYYPLASNGAVDLKAYYAKGPPTLFDLTNTNTVTRGSGPSNNLRDAAVFASASSQALANLTANPVLIPRAGLSAKFTVFGWVNVTTFANTTFPAIFGLNNISTSNRCWQVYGAQTSAQLRMVTYQTGGGTTNSDSGYTGVSTGTWYFMVCQFDGVSGRTLVRLYGGGSATQMMVGDSQGNVLTGAFQGGNSGVVFGNTQNGASFVNGNSRLDGSLAHWGVKAGILTNAQLAWLYNNGQGRDLTRGV